MKKARIEQERPTMLVSSSAVPRPSARLLWINSLRIGIFNPHPIRISSFSFALRLVEHLGRQPLSSGADERPSPQTKLKTAMPASMHFFLVIRRSPSPVASSEVAHVRLRLAQKGTGVDVPCHYYQILILFGIHLCRLSHFDMRRRLWICGVCAVIAGSLSSSSRC